MVRKYIIALLVVVGALILGSCASTVKFKSQSTDVQMLPADDKWVTFRTSQGETINALYAVPSIGDKHPAIIFNHGTGVRMRGYSTAVREGHMDAKEFIDALADKGYAAIAPIRTFEKSRAIKVRSNGINGSSEAWEIVIEGGIRVVNGAIDFLRSQPEISSDKIGIVGFSEGGLISLWSAIKRKDIAAVVLMSPANIRKAIKWNLKNATHAKQLQNISTPVFITLGKEDIKPIKKHVTKRLIPNMEKLGKDFQYNIDYPGDHKWFWKVREVYWKDIIRFLDQKIK